MPIIVTSWQQWPLAKMPASRKFFFVDDYYGWIVQSFQHHTYIRTHGVNIQVQKQLQNIVQASRDGSTKNKGRLETTNAMEHPLLYHQPIVSFRQPKQCFSSRDAPLHQQPPTYPCFLTFWYCHPQLLPRTIFLYLFALLFLEIYHYNLIPRACIRRRGQVIGFVRLSLTSQKRPDLELQVLL